MAIDKMQSVDQVISQVPGWQDTGDLQLQALRGLTNSNYAVTVDGERYILRVSGRNTETLGIDRELELEAIRAAAEADIGPPLVCSILPEGHLVTRFIEGRHLTLDEYRSEENLRRIVEVVKRLHALKPVRAVFSPFRRIEAYASRAQVMGVNLPHDFAILAERMKAIEGEQARDSYPWQGFCHNDLSCVNVLDDGAIHFVDWEFAGVGDIYYDLATLIYAYDSMDTLPRELQAYLQECYFGEATIENWDWLEGMKFMVMFFSAMWGLLQQGLQDAGLVPLVDGFSFFRYADTTFKAMRRAIE